MQLSIQPVKIGKNLVEKIRLSQKRVLEVYNIDL